VKTEVRYNSEWLNKLGYTGLINLAAKATLSQMLERDEFHQRFKEEQPIGVHELLYPLAQGYDSVMLKCDVELGGTDQKFNLLMGRELQRKDGQPPQIVLMTPISKAWTACRRCPSRWATPSESTKRRARCTAS